MKEGNDGDEKHAQSECPVGKKYQHSKSFYCIVTLENKQLWKMTRNDGKRWEHILLSRKPRTNRLLNAWCSQNCRSTWAQNQKLRQPCAQRRQELMYCSRHQKLRMSWMPCKCQTDTLRSRHVAVVRHHPTGMKNYALLKLSSVLDSWWGNTWGLLWSHPVIGWAINVPLWPAAYISRFHWSVRQYNIIRTVVVKR